MKKIGVMIISGLAVFNLSAGVLYQEDFSGTSENPLNGTVPDVRPGSETWSANGSDFTADGAFNGETASVQHTAALPFTVIPGEKYEFSVDMNITNPGGNYWAGIAILTTGNASFSASTASASALLLKQSGGAKAYSMMATGSTDDILLDAGTYASLNQTLKIVLDTENHTAEYFIGGSSIGTTTINSSLSGTCYAAIGVWRATSGFVDNYQLSMIPDLLTYIGDINLSVSGSNAVVNWQGAEGGIYTVQSRSELSSGMWSNLQENISGVVGTMQATNSLSGDQAFYRIVLD